MSAGPRIAVLGAGSIGCFIGGAWQANGLSVTFIGRPRIARDIEHNGMTVSDYSGWEVRLPPGDVDFRCGPEALASADIILVSVKSGDTHAAADEICKHGRDGAMVISFQNGISNLEVLEHQLAGRFEVARGMIRYNVVYLGDGRFHKAVAGDLWTEDRDLTSDLANRIGNGPAALKLSNDMLSLAWGKLLINMNNAVNALSGRTLLNELQERDYRRVFASAIEEGLQLLARTGIEPAKVGPVSFPLLIRILRLPDWLFNNLFFRLWKIDPSARSSMSDDLAIGRKTEVDYLNGELIRLADGQRVAAPVNRSIVELVHEAEKGAPSLAPKALRKAVLGS